MESYGFVAWQRGQEEETGRMLVPLRSEVSDPCGGLTVVVCWPAMTSGERWISRALCGIVWLVSVQPQEIST